MRLLQQGNVVVLKRPPAHGFRQEIARSMRTRQSLSGYKTFRQSRPISAAIRLRFSLRSLFVFVTAIAVAIAVALCLTKDYRQRMALRAELLSMGARWANVSDDHSISVLFIEPVGAKELKKYGKIGVVEFQQFSVDANSLRAFAGLTHVNSMRFQRCTVPDANDLSELSKIGGVHALLFMHTPIDDASIAMIAEVPGLEIVGFGDTKVTQAGVDQLHAARPEIRIDYRPSFP